MVVFRQRINHGDTNLFFVNYVRVKKDHEVF